MECSIFYSWQTDSPSRCNRAFIRSVIDAAVAKLGQDVGVEDSPRVESGMEGVAGTPEVAAVIFEKIKKSAVFVGDVTLVGTARRSSDGEEKRTPNPNVLLEMGFAAGVLGWERIICVMNEHFGTRQDLPFDVRNRRFPINYTLSPDNMAGEVRTKADLTKCIRGAIQVVLANEYSTAQEAIASLDVNCLNLIYTTGTQDWFPAPDSRVTTMGGPLDTAKFNAAVTRLLDLRVLKTDFNPAERRLAYHWTYLGKQVLIQLGIRQPPAKPAQAREVEA